MWKKDLEVLWEDKQKLERGECVLGKKWTLLFHILFDILVFPYSKNSIKIGCQQLKT